jgi:hypothetical protein
MFGCDSSSIRTYLGAFRVTRKLTISEKESRGTRQKAYDPKPRRLADIRAEIELALESLDDVQFSAKEAGKSIRELGVLIPSGRGATSTHKPNPAIRIQAWALTAVRGIRRELVFLREEELLAMQAHMLVDDEFAGLD